MKTERTRTAIIRALITRKMARPRRIVIAVGAALPRAFVDDARPLSVGGRGEGQSMRSGRGCLRVSLGELTPAGQGGEVAG